MDLCKTWLNSEKGQEDDRLPGLTGHKKKVVGY